MNTPWATFFALAARKTLTFGEPGNIPHAAPLAIMHCLFLGVFGNVGFFADFVICKAEDGYVFLL